MNQATVKEKTFSPTRWRWIFAVALAVGVLGFLQVTSFADEEPKQFEASVITGASIPTDYQTQIVHTEPELQGSFLAPVTSWLSAGLEAGYSFKSTWSQNLEFANA